MSSLLKYAKKELERAGLFDKDGDYNGDLGPAVLALLREFSQQGHSGASAGLALYAFSRLADYKPLTPVDNPTNTGEYISCDLGDTVWQSTRIASLFSMDNGRSWYDIDLPLKWWQRPLQALWRLGVKVPASWRRVYVTFPITY